MLTTPAASGASRGGEAKRNAKAEGIEEAPLEKKTGCECEWVVQ